MYYFISNKKLDNTILEPRVPKNIGKTENSTIPRICVSKSLLGCIKSTGIHTKYKRIYVHTCVSIDIYQPNMSDVSDGFMFGEEWITSPTLMTLLTTLHVSIEYINEYYSKWIFRDINDIINFNIIEFDYNRYYNKRKCN